MAVHDIAAPRVTPNNTPATASAPAFEDFTYADVRPMLDRGADSQSLALVHIANLASCGRAMRIEQATDAILNAVALIDLDSPRRSESNMVRLEAVVVLRAIATRAELLLAVPKDVRELAFGVLACLPIARVTGRESFGCLSNEVSFGPREKDAGVRALCESVAGLYAESRFKDVTPLVEQETAPFLPWPEPARPTE